MSDALAAPAEHFASLEQQAHGARLGMAIFVASEALLFSALFALFAGYQAQYAGAFHQGVLHNTKVFGSVNTGILLTSSALVACGVQTLRAGDRRATAWLLRGTIGLGLVFLVVKLIEYGVHLHEGIRPGGAGAYFAEHARPGLAQYWTLYYVMTGLHAAHVIVGLSILSWALHGVRSGRIAPPRVHPLEICALYWHLVDVIWIFLWPLIYLA